MSQNSWKRFLLMSVSANPISVYVKANAIYFSAVRCHGILEFFPPKAFLITIFLPSCSFEIRPSRVLHRNVKVFTTLFPELRHKVSAHSRGISSCIFGG